MLGALIASWLASLAILAAVVLVLERSWAVERRELVSRVQAGTLRDYVALTERPPERNEAALHPVRAAVERARRALMDGGGGEG